MDSLSYVDLDYDENMEIKNQVDLLVADEMKRFSFNNRAVISRINGQVGSENFMTDILRNHFEEMKSRSKASTIEASFTDKISTVRYQLPEPTDFDSLACSADKNESKNDSTFQIRAWRVALDNAKAQLNQQHFRLVNLDLYTDYSCYLWRHYSQQSSVLLKQLEAELNYYEDKMKIIGKKRLVLLDSSKAKIEYLQQQYEQLTKKTNQLMNMDEMSNINKSSSE